MEVIWHKTEEEERQFKQWAEWGLENQLPPFVIAENIGIEKGLEKGREEGLEEGLEKGREEGLEKGREEGLEKGREEGLEKGMLMERQNTVLSLHAEGFRADAIERITKLPPEEISRIIASHSS